MSAKYVGRPIACTIAKGRPDRRLRLRGIMDRRDRGRSPPSTPLTRSFAQLLAAGDYHASTRTTFAVCCAKLVRSIPSLEPNFTPGRKPSIPMF